ncbi:MAG TPA: ATP-binding protein [Bacteroidales bacterium]|nr:ATP-binding protein [Bacteroidales bacterium]
MISNKIQLIIPSLLDQMYQVEKFVEEICDEFNINNTYFGNIIVALTEAVENAIKHGNANNSSKKVEITFITKNEGLSFVVKDEGAGFNANTIPDPTDINTKEEETKGRGIFLIKSLADEVNFLGKGNEVEIIFKIASINSEMAIERIQQLKKYSGMGVKKTSSTDLNELS